LERGLGGLGGFKADFSRWVVIGTNTKFKKNFIFAQNIEQ
jgi:hypothetical protein